MDIEHKIIVPVEVDIAFSKFIAEVRNWWPQAYTWSGGALSDLLIEPRKGGHCIEIGPGNFRCDWGTVVSITPGKELSFLWQISPRREPVPDPAKASLVSFEFESIDLNRTQIILHHKQFNHHGDGHKVYAEALNSPKGWPFILDSFLLYVEATDT